MLVRIKPIVDKAIRKIERGANNQMLNLIVDLRAQMEDFVDDINPEPLNNEICPKIGRLYTFAEAYELMAYKTAFALNDNVVPGYMPYFYIHLNDGVLPYFRVQVTENDFIDEILKENLKRENKTFQSFGDFSIPPQIIFIKLERPPSNQKMPIRLHELLDLTEFGGEKYEVFCIVQTKQPGRDTNVIMSLLDQKGWIRIDNKEIYVPQDFLLNKEIKNTATPVMYVGYIQGKSAIETFRPGQSIERSSMSSTMKAAAQAIIQERELNAKNHELLDEPRPLTMRMFDPSSMAVTEIPGISFRSFDEFRNQVKSLKNNMIAKGSTTCQMYYKEEGETEFRDLPTEIPPEGAEVIGDMTGCVGFVNDFFSYETLDVKITCLTKPDFYSINVKFVKYQKVSEIRDFINRALAPTLQLPEKNRYVYYWDGEAYMIADDEKKIASFDPLEFFFTNDGKPPDGSHVLRMRFVEVSPVYKAIDTQFSHNTIQTIDDLKSFAQRKFMFHDIDFYTFQQSGPRLYVFPPTLGKTHQGKKLNPMMLFEGIESPLFAQEALPIKADTAILNFVIAEEIKQKLKLTNDAFRLDFDLFTPWKEAKVRLLRVLNTKKIDVIYVVNQGDKIPLDDKMPAKDLTKGIFFVKVL